MKERLAGKERKAEQGFFRKVGREEARREGKWKLENEKCKMEIAPARDLGSLLIDRANLTEGACANPPF